MPVARRCIPTQFTAMPARSTSPRQRISSAPNEDEFEADCYRSRRSFKPNWSPAKVERIRQFLVHRGTGLDAAKLGEHLPRKLMRCAELAEQRSQRR
jgi:hypothetical protein